MGARKGNKARVRKSGKTWNKKKNIGSPKKLEKQKNRQLISATSNKEVKETILDEKSTKPSNRTKNSKANVEIITDSSNCTQKLNLHGLNTLKLGLKSYPMVKLEKIPDWINQSFNLSPKEILEKISMKNSKTDLNSDIQYTKKNAKRKLTISTSEPTSSDLIKKPKQTLDEKLVTNLGKKPDKNLDKILQSNLNKKSDSDCNKKTGSNLKKKSASNLSIKSDSVFDKTVNSNTKSDPNLDKNRNNKKSNSNVDKQLNSQRESVSDLDKKSELVSDTKSDPNLNKRTVANFNNKSNINLNKKLNFSLEIKSDTNLDKKCMSDLDEKPDSVLDKKADVNTKLISNLDKIIDSDMNKKLDSNLNNKSNPNLHKESIANLNKKLDSNTKTDAYLDKKIYSNLNKKIKSNLDKKINMNLDIKSLGLRKKSASNLDIKSETVLDKKVYSKMKSKSNWNKKMDFNLNKKSNASSDFDKKLTPNLSRRRSSFVSDKEPEFKMNRTSPGSNKKTATNPNKKNKPTYDKYTTRKLHDENPKSNLDISKEPKKIPRTFWNTVETYSEEEFQVNFRVSKSTANYIINIYKRMPDNTGYVLGSKEEILIFLFYMGNTMTYKQLGNIFDLPDGKAWQTVLRVSTWLIKEQNTYIKWPQKEDIVHVTNVFEKIISIPGVIGVIDKIIVPCPQVKANNVFEVHTIVDGEFKFNHVSINSSSSVGKKDFFPESDFFKKVSLNEEDMFPNNTFIIGNKDYPLETWLIPPFDEDQELTESQIKLNNNIQLANRMISKKALESLCSRFRRLVHLPKNFSLNVIQYLIISAFILHNICIMQNDNSSLILQN